MPRLPPQSAPLDAEDRRAHAERTDVELLELDLPATHLTQLSQVTPRVTGRRLEGAELRRLHCRRVVFGPCDFAGSTWVDCDFNADLARNDLRDNELGRPREVACLRGVTVDVVRLLALGPALAAAVGLNVKERSANAPEAVGRVVVRRTIAVKRVDAGLSRPLAG